jgi:hypothetical protein
MRDPIRLLVFQFGVQPAKLYWNELLDESQRLFDEIAHAV